MTDHLKPQSPELVAALRNHGLKSDQPSQLSDAFRLGWNAALVSTTVQFYPADPVAEAARMLKNLRDLCGYVENGSDTVVSIFQDDATREWVVKAGKKHVAYGSSFTNALCAITEASHDRD